ncbi:MAG: carbamoyltransferase HypF, partial [Actinomycetota bacterium]
MGEKIRRRLSVEGTVQGVGFRPFVFRLAERYGLAGFVRNDGDGVTIEIEGEPVSVRAFQEALVAERPPLASIAAIREERIVPVGDDRFEIRASGTLAGRRTDVTPDAAVCEECIAEITDPADRRFRYPFTNCTNCGPRFTIVERIPYDRANTTMRRFEMCSDCAGEYHDRSGRRFHAQPIACPACGPRLQLLDATGRAVEGDPIEGTARLLREGSIVAIKGIGGFHLACDALDRAAVSRLRERKHREEKPLAVMVRDLLAAASIAEIGEVESGVLGSFAAPIVLLPKVAASPLADEVAPGAGHVGVMLPYSPLHHLLMAELDGPIVLTSGNLSDEPIAYRNSDALERLGGIADAILVHDRPIRTRCDDSVVRVIDDRTYPIRRSRGYAPSPLRITPGTPVPVLAVGAELKNTFCLAFDDVAVVSHHIGDLHDHLAFSAFLDGVGHLQELFEVRPTVVAHDLHPAYL